jgi:hypothetical protein
MKLKICLCTHCLLWSLVLPMILPPSGIMAQGTETGRQMIFTQEDLDQMLAPIALYPDDLLSQVLMAATYPLEVVQAARWVQANSYLRGDPLAMALEQQNWDPSVKSMVNFPDILQMMNDHLEWMQRLGDAFLAQPDQVMETIQKLREKAQAQGSLRTTSEQRVIYDPQSRGIIIEPADPQVIYVPVYDPMIVYGPWWWPAYPPFYYHPRGVIFSGGFIGFGSGVAIGLPWGYAWGGCDWQHHRVAVNISRNVYINNRIDRNRYAGHVTTGSGGRGVWTHDPEHRRGVAYRTPAIGRQFGRGTLPGAEARQGFRGYDQPAPGGGSVPRSNRPIVQPPQVTSIPSPARSEPFRAAVPQPRVTPSPMPARVERPKQLPGPGHQEIQGMQSHTAFGGLSPGGQTRQDSLRGHESLSGPRPAAPMPAVPGPAINRPAPGGGRPANGPGGQRGK